MSRLSRTASVSTAWLALASLLVLGGLVGLLFWNSDRQAPPGTEPVLVFCAAGLQEPMAAVAREYEEAYGIPVQVQYGGSQTLLANAEVGRRGDLYIPADDSYIGLAQKKGLLDETLPVAQMTPVLAVRKGNPKKIASLDDLKRSDVTLAQANPDAAAIGKVVRAALEKSGHWTDLRGRTQVFKMTVNDVANDIKVGAADAGFVWDANLAQYPDLEAVPVPELKGLSSQISAAILHSTSQPTTALRFARYLAARDKGLTHFEKSGFQVVDGDVWSAKPELRLFAGAMLRPAIEDSIDAFEKREGVTVDRVYNGCGILVSQMKACKRPEDRPDFYFACDKSFMDMVSDMYLDAADVSTNQLVILVPKGNPHEIKGLEDLARPGIRVGVGDEHKCALGVLTQITLQQGKVRDPIMKKEPIQRPTGDMLVNDLRVKGVDAAIAYLSNARAAGDELEAITVDLPCAIAVQPMAVGKASPHKYLAGRLKETLRSAESRKQFEAAGFHWQEKKP